MADVGGEGPRLGQAGLLGGRWSAGAAAHLAGKLVLRPIERVPIQRGSAGVHPDMRRTAGSRDCLADQARGNDAGIVDFTAVRGRVAGIDRASGEMDDRVGLFELRGPRALKVDAIPVHHAPGGRFGNGRPAENDDPVAGRMEVTGEDGANLAGAARKHNLHTRAITP